MRSRIFTGHLMHRRLEPLGHGFDYPIYFYAFDLDELEVLSREVPWFGYNRLRPVSIHDRDYLDNRNGTIKEKLFRFLREKGLAEGVDRVELITGARYFNYVFNPVSFYYCYGPSDRLQTVVAEVNNTFQEKHLYILSGSGTPRPGFEARYTVPKDFHVSPFNDMSGNYDFHFSAIDQDLDIRVNLLKEGREVFHSRMWGTAMPMTSKNLLGTLVRYPLTASLSMPRILWQAGRLYLRGLKVFTKPHPKSALTIRVAGPTLWQKACLRLFIRWLAGLQKGCLTLVLPDKSYKLFGDPQAPSERSLTLRVKTWDFFPRMVWGGDVAFGETYMEGDWETERLADLLQIMAENWGELAESHPWTAFWGRLKAILFHLTRGNTPAGSRKNIQAHYDLSNDFFKAFLDDSMTYSSAFYEEAGSGLEAAQKAKIAQLLGKAQLGPHDHLLEIGTGWGTLAIEAAQRTGCRVTSVTISKEQFEYAKARVESLGLSERVRVELRDYRHLTGSFDRIISVEMLEAVGHEHYGTYFKTLDRLLKPGGWAVLQVITLPDQRYAQARRGEDFIQKYIFPGSVIPSIKALNDAMTSQSQLVLEDLENIGPHYALTLAEWARRFRENRGEIIRLGFDEKFQRMWLYYLAYCEAGFASGLLNNLQLILARPMARNQGPVVVKREAVLENVTERGRP